MQHRVACEQQLRLTAQELHRAVVEHAVGEFGHRVLLAQLAHLVNHLGGMPHSDEVDALRVSAPAIVIHVAIKVSAVYNVSLLARFEAHHAQSVKVALVAIAPHALPGNVLSVGREAWIDVVTHHHVALLMVYGLLGERLGVVDGRLLISFGLADVARRTCLRVEEIDVGIGRIGISHALLLTTCVGYGLRVGAPVQLFHASEGSHGALVRLTLQYVGALSHCSVGRYVSHEGMRDTLHVVVPVAVVHIRHQSSGGLRQVVGVLLDASVIRYALHQHHLLAVGRELEALYVGGIVRELSPVRAVGSHAPELSVGEKEDSLAVGRPYGVGLVVGRCGELAVQLAVG